MELLEHVFVIELYSCL